MRYRFVDEHRERWRVERMCPLLNVSRSGYYAWRDRPQSARDRENEQLMVEIRRIYDEGRGEYGSPTVCGTLRDEGHRVNPKRIARLMGENRLYAKVTRRFKRTTRRCKDADASPNLLEQNFTTTGPNRVWLFGYHLHLDR